MHHSLVTGVGHQPGIGYAVAMRLQQRGDRVFVTRHRAFDAARRHSQNGDVTWPCADVDLGDPSAASVILSDGGGGDRTNRHPGGQPCMLQAGNLGTLEANVPDRRLAVNVRRSMLLVKGFAPATYRLGPRRLYDVGPSLHPMPDTLSSALSKGAIEAASLCLAASLARSGITVDAVDTRDRTDSPFLPLATSTAEQARCGDGD